MQNFSKKSLLGFVLSMLFVLVVVFLDPNGKVLQNFDKNNARSYYFEHCTKNTDISTTATSTLLHVVDISDGDTIIVSKNCEPITVRLIGVDTPETVDPRKPVQCFGKEASDFTKAHLKGRDITIETDDSQNIHDKYGRLLGYVILADGTNFNKQLIEEGFAHEYTYKTPYKYQTEFKTAEKNAKDGDKGLWNPTACK